MRKRNETITNVYPNNIIRMQPKFKEKILSQIIYLKRQMSWNL